MGAGTQEVGVIKGERRLEGHERKYPAPPKPVNSARLRVATVQPCGWRRAESVVEELVSGRGRERA